MGRHGLNECDNGDALSFGRWRAQVKSTMNGKRGQAFLRELVASLDAMPVKRLIKGELRKDGEVCAIGSVGVKRGTNLEALDFYDPEAIAKEFGITHQLVSEIEWTNDEHGYRDTPEERWTRMRKWAAAQLNIDSEQGADDVRGK